ncbi:3-dehydroquinate synthase [Thermoanaerobacterium sp. RBIITD]|uniref:3-dehydroquinate synthase n=1 Tax=Thermoanaerobacterium sp. RBIITD TaxID=1550240 RepID=UPI000BB75EF3|nr:3-dehydroquinate synthase [Thermoanaerobacterium sp. RBIITD]SNX52699.1 3-dehydroquinate synthase [Thermoanaerobacterium sp. RBIITD]
MQIVNINLKEHSYPIYISKGMLNNLSCYIEKHLRSNKIFIITDSNVSNLYLNILEKSLELSGNNTFHTIIKAGEESKNLETIKELLEECYRHELLRDSTIIALGGGVVGDIAGFVAATYMRGIDFIQVPTTLLAQVDSSVGGKVGVNLKNGKNIAGAFHQPKAVFIDTGVIKTLNKREIRGGLSEIIKYGIIRDADLFNYIEYNLSEILNLNDDMISHLIKRSCEIKGEIVSIDEKENNLRAILNYGHTIGHAIEALTGYKKYIHGEAVAIGMVCAAKIALNRKYIDVSYYERIKSLLKASGLPINYGNLNKNDIVNLIKHDKKNRESKIKFILPKCPGKVDIFDVTEDEILNILN